MYVNSFTQFGMLEIGINQITNLCPRKEIIRNYRFKV